MATSKHCTSHEFSAWLALGAICAWAFAANCNVLAQDPVEPTPVEELRKKLAAAKDLGEQFQLQGQILAAEPNRIPDDLPGLLERAGNFKAGELYVGYVLKPCAARALPTLLRMLESENAMHANRAESGLSTILEVARPAVITTLAEHRSIPIRIRAAHILGRDSDMDRQPALRALRSQFGAADVGLRIESALAALSLDPVNEAAIETLRVNYSQDPEQILTRAFRARPLSRDWRGILELGLANREHRAWRAQAALHLLELDGDWTPQTHHAAIEGLFTNDAERAGLAEACAVALGKHSKFEAESLAQLTRICDSSDSRSLVAAASGAILRLDASQTDLRLPAVITALPPNTYSRSKTEALLVLAELGSKARSAEPTLLKLLQSPRHHQQLLTALTLLRLQPSSPEAAHDVIRQALSGQLKTGRMGASEFELPLPELKPLRAELLAAIDSATPARVELACQLLQASGPAAAEFLPELIKRKQPGSDRNQQAVRAAIDAIENRNH